MIGIYQKIAIFTILIGLIQSATIGKHLQVPDKDPTLKALVYKEGLPKANAKIHDTVLWVPATTQFSARRITVMNQGKLYSTWTYDMLLQQSNCPSRVADL
uniref:Neur_chan_LBD domain-containing protein n=1 Tax=Caenorhabditis tropicalis TaxID=1561998 RepID=A0A1I7TGD9_9PELO